MSCKQNIDEYHVVLLNGSKCIFQNDREKANSNKTRINMKYFHVLDYAHAYPFEKLAKKGCKYTKYSRTL